MTKEETTKEATKLIADAMREALRTLASEAETAKRVIATDAGKAVQVIKDDNGGFVSILYKQVSLILGICGTVLAGFIFLTSPGTKNDTALQLQEQRIEAQDGTILALTKTQQNDTQEVKANVALMTSKIEQQSVEIAKLTTIINERIPARK
jgi:hypothetical protein